LIATQLKQHAPWPVQWIDSGEAIARRALSLVEGDKAPLRSIAYVTAEADVARYREVFLREGFDEVKALKL
jgi:glutamate racemase